MHVPRPAAVPAFALAFLAGACIGLWLVHAKAWDLGGRSPVLGYDAAQYAVAARELSEHGRLATPFALPVELTKAARPPWPLALVQPGLVVSEALLFRLSAALPPQTMQWLVLLLPFACYLVAAIVLARAASALIARHAPDVSNGARALAALTVGLAFALDPEAQHFSGGGFTEMPFTLVLALALAWIARGGPARPLAFGLLLGLGGLFRGSMMWLAPALALGYAASMPAGRVTAIGRTMLGCALVLAPWWIYKWWSFGTPAWDLSALSIWDGVGGRTWFSLNHLPELPDVPTGISAICAIAVKFAENAATLALRLAVGPRALWIGALLIAALVPRTRGDAVAPHDARPLHAAAWTTLALLLMSVAAAAVSIPLARYLAPARLIGEAAGLIAVWALILRMPSEWAGAGARRGVCVALAVLAIGWGLMQTTRGLREALDVADQRGIPDTPSMLRLARWVDGELKGGETVMSNLGPSLAWYSRRPVIHLALTPADLDACRRRAPFDRVLVVFRSPKHAWPGWSDLVERPQEATHNREWNITNVRVVDAAGGFTALWLELGPLAAPLARR